MTDPQEVMATHRSLLEKWRRAMDLVGPGPLDEHFDDAGQTARLLDFRGDWADLGSGAGFPGIALAAWHPEARVVLVESREKRAVFLKQVVRVAGLANARVIHGRAEDLPLGSLDGIIARAFAPPAVFLELARPLLRPAGLVVVMAARDDAVEHPHLRLSAEKRYDVGGKPRTLFIYTLDPTAHRESDA